MVTNMISQLQESFLLRHIVIYVEIHYLYNKQSITGPLANVKFIFDC